MEEKEKNQDVTPDSTLELGVDMGEGNTIEPSGKGKRSIKGRKDGNGVERSKTPDVYTSEQIKQIEDMAEAQCKDTTIAVAMGFDVDTFRRDHASRTEQKRAEGKTRILLSQFKMAQSQPVMGIWFGKQHLEQRDKSETEVSGSVGHHVVMFGQEQAPKAKPVETAVPAGSEVLPNAVQE